MTRRLGEGHELRGPVTEEVTGPRSCVRDLTGPAEWTPTWWNSGLRRFRSVGGGLQLTPNPSRDNGLL